MKARQAGFSTDAIDAAAVHRARASIAVSGLAVPQRTASTLARRSPGHTKASSTF